MTRFSYHKKNSDHVENFEQERERALHSVLFSKYEVMDTGTVVQAQRHQSAEQKVDLEKLFKKYSKLFSGQLGEYEQEKIHLHIDPTIKPSRRRPYISPHHQRQVFKEELDRLMRIGVLKPCVRSKWIAGTFIIPENDGRIRWL